jgi:hypothetical protein
MKVFSHWMRGTKLLPAECSGRDLLYIGDGWKKSLSYIADGARYESALSLFMVRFSILCFS